MSILFAVAPMMIGEMALMAEAASSVAEDLGYTVEQTNTQAVARENHEISIEGSQVIADAMKRNSEFSLRKGDVTATFKRGVDGRLVVHLSGSNTPEIQLRAMGEELVARTTQQYAYKKVMEEMKKRGFNVTSEEVGTDNTIKIKVSKYV